LVRHIGHWLEMVESLLIVGILLAIAWLSWQALSQAYGPVFNLMNRP
jgi:TRAP-type C4-dicarboxylate transport system permease small subunit